eukprot:1160356-Pelagomonas_calceolata.AAC.3
MGPKDETRCYALIKQQGTALHCAGQTSHPQLRTLFALVFKHMWRMRLIAHVQCQEVTSESPAEQPEAATSGLQQHLTCFKGTEFSVHSFPYPAAIGEWLSAKKRQGVK